MLHNLKRSVQLVVVLGVAGAFAAPAALASPEFTAFNPSTLEHAAEASLHGSLMETLEGSQVHEFGTGAFAVQCSSATFAGTSGEEPSSTQAFSPTYSECEATTGGVVDVEMNSCKYVVHLESEPTALEYTGTADLTCPESETPTLTVTNTGCVIHLQPSEGLATVVVREAEGKMEVEMSLSEVPYTSTGTFFKCGMTEGEHKNGTYDGNVTVAASAGEEELVLQAVPSELISAPGTLKIEKDVKNEGTITLSTKSKNEFVVKSSNTSAVYKIKQDNCFQKKVTCTIEVECQVKGQFAPFTSTALDTTTKLYHAAVTKIECV